LFHISHFPPQNFFFFHSTPKIINIGVKRARRYGSRPLLSYFLGQTPQKSLNLVNELGKYWKLFGGGRFYSTGRFSKFVVQSCCIWGLLSIGNFYLKSLKEIGLCLPQRERYLVSATDNWHFFVKYLFILGKQG